MHIHTHKVTVMWQISTIHSYPCQLFRPPWCRARKCKHCNSCVSYIADLELASTKLFLNLPIQFYLNKVSPWRDVTLLTRRVLPPGKLRCAVECYRRRRQMPIDDDRHQRPLLVWSLALCNNVINLHQLSSQQYATMPYNMEIMSWPQITLWRHSTLCIHGNPNPLSSTTRNEYGQISVANAHKAWHCFFRICGIRLISHRFFSESLQLRRCNCGTSLESIDASLSILLIRRQYQRPPWYSIAQ